MSRKAIVEEVKEVQEVDLDELTVLKIQNAQIQIAVHQERAQAALNAFMNTRGLTGTWSVDLNTWKLTKKE